jgi:carbamoyltransferase
MAVLGLCAFTHDSAAALFVNGQLVGFCEEERLSGEKHTAAYPARAVSWLLHEAGLIPSQINVVGYNFRPGAYLTAVADTGRQLAGSATRGRALPRAVSFVKVATRTGKRLRAIGFRFPAARVVPVLHHRTHGLYAFASSGYDAAAVLVVDSLGETQTTTIAHARRSSHGCDYQIRHAIGDPASLGYLYGAVTEHLGWRRGDEEGTVMALAALGDPARFRDLFARAVPLTETGFALDPTLVPPRVLSRRYPRLGTAFAAATCPPRHSDAPLEPIHADLAAALQERTEQVMLHLATRARRLTGSGLLCLAGGVAANCVAAGRIAEAGLFDEIHVPPAPGDSGTAIGAALACHLRLTRRLPEGVAGECYLGPEWTDVAPALVSHNGNTARVDQPARFLAAQLAAGKIVGVFRGRLEAGPRALGNRSILASPLLSDVVQRLNATVKFREPFRPFAPVVPADHADDYFTLGQPAPFMSIASGVTELARSRIPTIVHTNGTARVQTVAKGQNPFLASVLDEFATLTGVPVLINTSLNVKGKPICGTPTMAVETLTNTGLDGLLIEDWWVTK